MFAYFFYDPAAAFKKALIRGFAARYIRVSAKIINNALIAKAKPDQIGPA